MAYAYAPLASVEISAPGGFVVQRASPQMGWSRVAMLAVAGALAGAAGTVAVEGRRLSLVKMKDDGDIAMPSMEEMEAAAAEEAAEVPAEVPAEEPAEEKLSASRQLESQLPPAGSWARRIPMLATDIRWKPTSVEQDTRVGVASSAETLDDLKVLANQLNPVVGYYDPLNLSKMEFWDQSNGATISFLRHAEIKHGRVAMAGFVGFIVHANGIHFPWKIPGDELCAPGVSPALLWDNMPFGAKLQIILALGLFEAYSEAAMSVVPGQGGHYMRGGKPGYFPPFKLEGGGKSGTGILEDADGQPLLPHSVPWNLYDPFGLNKDKSEEWKAKKLITEINNGRLAMLGLMSFLSEGAIPGSVPALKGLIPESGAINVMRPFFFQASLLPAGLESLAQ
jgi:hypothetical protein